MSIFDLYIEYKRFQAFLLDYHYPLFRFYANLPEKPSASELWGRH